MTAQSLPFMLEMAVNPASTLGESTQSMLARYALSRFAKKGATRAAQKFATKAAGAAGRALGDIAGSAVMAGTSGAVRVAGDAIDRHVGDIETDMDGQGQTVFAGHDPESLGKSIAKAFTSTAIENHSEMLGEYFAPALGIVSKLGRKGMEKFGLKNVVDFVDDVSATDAAKLIADFQKRTKWHGTIGEYAEEVVGNIENAILVGDSTLDSSDDTGVFNLDQNIDTFLGVALMGGVFSTIRTAAWRTPKYRARKEMEKARAKAKKKFGDQEWQDIEDRLAEAGDEGMSSVLSEVIIGERNPEREKAILDYAKSIKIYEGTLKGDEKHRELSSPEMTDLESSYENGYTLATPQEVHDAKIMFEYQQARLQQALGMSSIDIETLMLGNEMGKLTEEQKSVALDYLNAEATFDGVIDRVRDDIDNRISSVNAAIDASTNSDTGKLQPARLVDDRAVHIISGIVRLTPDGTMVDIHNSEDYIIIRDDKTGKIESVSPSQIVGLDAEIDPESEKKAAESQIRGQIGQQKADIIDGVLQFNPGDVYTLTNEQGQSFTVQIAADKQGIVDNGDGTINVILNEDIDANTGLPRISQMSKEQIENMAEATNMARLQQYEQQKLDVDARQYKEDSTGRTPENPFKINDRISFNDVGSGSVKHGIVESELTDDGKYEIAIENDGSIESVSYLSPEDLSNMQAQLVQSVEEQEAPEIEQNPVEIKQNPVEIEQPEQSQVSAFERIPKDEQGNPIYEQAETPELAWDAIVEQTDGDEAMAQTVTDGMVADKETALKKVEKAKSKGGATIAEKIAAEKERKAAIEEAKANLAVWKQIAQTARRRKDAEESEKRRIAEEQAAIRKVEEEKLRAEREEAERIKREALNGVPDISDDTPQDARARGYRRVSGHKVDRQEPIPHLQGNDIAVKFSDDVIVPGRVAVIEAETLQPSHIQGTRNPAHFIDESQPKERTDDASVLSARKIARNIRPEEITSSITAYTGAPTTNVRGEVIQGNNRSDALRLIWEGDKEQSAIYKQYLMDHAADFGLNADEISAMNHPVLVNMLDVDDATAITLGQFVAQDTESGGTERIKPKNAVQKMGADMRTFADMLLASSDDETSFAGLVDRNGDEVLAWMNRRGFITPTQYKSAFDSKGGITAEAKNDLKGIMYQSIFTGGNIRLEEMFNAMPAKAQRAILATAFRDNESPNTERMVKEIQNSIRAYNALSQGEDFANAKNWKEARLAVESWKMQYAMDDVTGESYLPAEKFSNFALHLATMYKGESQSLIQSTFNHLYDLIQGTQEETLFEKPDNTPRTLAQAILETLNFEYDGQQRSNVLAGDSTASQEREQGSTGTPAAGERVEGGEQPSDNTGGTENESGSGEVREKIAEEGSKVNTNPSDAQKEAGNYRMGHVKIDGMDVTIENPKGSIRKGRDADGKEWQSEMHNDYGYIRGTKAVDNDHIDIFLSDNPETGNVFVVDQVNPKTGEFDESKVMYGFSSEQEARDAYLSNYEEGWKGLGKITEVTKEEFKKWIDSSTRKTKPFAEYRNVKKVEFSTVTPNTEVGYTVEPAQYTTKRGKVLDMQLVKFGRKLTKDELRSAKELAKGLKGWYDSKQTGFMMRSKEDAQQLVDAVMDESGETLSDAAPISLQDVRKVNKDSISAGPTIKEEEKPADVSAPAETEAPKNEGAFGLVSDDRMAELKERLRKKLGGQLNMGIDPEILAIGMELAVGHIDRGIRTFADFSKKMIEDLGDVIRPYLKAFYNGARDLPEVIENGLSAEMTPYDEVSRFDVANFDKESTDPFATAEMVVSEQEKMQQADEAKKDIVNKRNTERRKDNEKSEADTETIVSKAEAVADKAESDIEDATDEKQLSEIAKTLDDQIEKINSQLALLGFYEAEEVEKDFNEMYGYMRNAEKKAVKDANVLAEKLVEDLGINPATLVDRKGKKLKSLAGANIAPTGGDISFRLPLTDVSELYFTIILNPDRSDNLSVESIMYRIEDPTASGQYRYGNNNWAEPNVEYGDLLKAIKSVIKRNVTGFAMPAKQEEKNASEQMQELSQQVESGESSFAITPKIEKKLAESNAEKKSSTPFKVGDKVMYKGEEATIYDIDNGRPVLDTGLAPVMYEMAEWTDLSPVTQATENKQPKNSTKKKKSVSSHTEVADLFSSLFNEETLNSKDNENGLQRNDAVRSEGLSADGGKHAERLSEGSEKDSGSEPQEGSGLNAGRKGTGVETDRSVRPRLSDTVEEFAPSEHKNSHNNHSERGENHAPTSVDARIEANIKAIELAQQLIDSGEQATEKQMQVLRKFSGWGGLGKAFSDSLYSAQLQNILGAEAYQDAVMSANSAYYTPAYVVDTLWDIAEQLGFKGGNILEGSAGIGNILGQMPANISERSDIHAIEIDGTSGNILSLLYPDAKVDIQGFEQTRIPNGSVDLAITNVPFVTGLRVNDTTGDKDLSKKFHNIHDFCIAKNVRKLS